MPRFLGIILMFTLASCVSTPTASTSNNLISVSCNEDMKISLGKLMGVKCTFTNTGLRPTNVVVRSVKTNSSDAKVLSPKELEELAAAMREVQKGQSLAPGTVGFIYFGTLATASASASGGVEALIPMALATGFIALAATQEDEEKMAEAARQRTYHESHMLHGAFAVDRGISLKKEVYIGPVEKGPPESLTICLDAPTSECIAVPLQPDASRYRQRS